jgi:uncharacterized repeat protein (TIGR01451 family)
MTQPSKILRFTFSAAALLLLAVSASAQTYVTPTLAPTPPGQLITVTNLAGDQSDPHTVHVGQGLSYALVVHNLGSNTATSVVVTDPLPVDTVFVEAISSQGSCKAPVVGSPGTVICDLGNIINGSYAVVGIGVKVIGGAGTTITNRATVSAGTSESNPNISTSWTVSRRGGNDKKDGFDDIVVADGVTHKHQSLVSRFGSFFRVVRVFRRIP